MKLHASKTINFTAHANSLCQKMNRLVRLGMTVDEASRFLNLSRTSGRSYYNGSYDVNPGYKSGRAGKTSYTCVRLGAYVAI